MESTNQPLDITPVNTADTTPAPIDLSTVVQPKPLPEDLVLERAKKFTESVSEITRRTPESIAHEIRQGREDNLRLEVATALNNREQIKRQQVVATIAKQRNEPITPDEYRLIMMNPTPFDPESAPEKEYAKYYMQVLEKPDTFMSDVYTEQERKEVQDIKNLGGDYISKREQLLKEAQDMGTKVQNQSTLGFIVDQAKGLIPLYNEYMQRGLIPNVGIISGGLLQGDNIEEQAVNLFRLPQEQFTQVLKNIRTNFADNPSLGAGYINALLGQSSDEKALNNFFSLLEPAGLPIVGGAKVAATGFRAATSRAVKDVVKSSFAKTVTRADAEAAAGNMVEAALEKSANRVVNHMRGQAPSPTDDIFPKLPSALRADQEAVRANPGRFSEDFANKLDAAYETGIGTFLKSVADKINVDRTPALIATKEQLGEFVEFVKKSYPGRVSNNIMDVSAPIYNPTTNTYSVNLQIGKSGNELFGSHLAAQQFARANGLAEGGYKIEQLGTGRYISITKPVNETEGFVRDLLTATKISQDPDSLLSAFVGWLRNPDETLSLHQRMERKNATFGPSNLLKVAKDEAKYISQLKKGWGGKKRWEDFERVLNAGKTTIDPADGKPGWFAQHPVELDGLYQRTLGRLPNEAETEAYFAYKRITEYDRIHRELLVQRNMRRAGAEQHQFTVLGDEVGTKIQTGFINGVYMKELPGTDDTMLVLGKRVGEQRMMNAKSFMATNSKEVADLKDDIRAGRKVVVRIWDPESRPLKQFPGVGNSRVRYVIHDAVESKPIAWGQIPRRGGGHYEFDYDNYIKQAKIRVERQGNTVNHWYEGDQTVMPIALRAMGRDVVKHLEEVRKKLKARDVRGAKAVFDKFAPAGMEWKDVRGWFVRKRVNGIMEEPLLSLDEPFQLVGRDQKIVDIDNSLQNRYLKTFRNGTMSGSDARQLQVQFTGERDARDLMTINNEGTRYNPIYKYEPAKFVDPLTTMDRSYSKVVNSAYMDDYKIMSVETWLEKAKPYLKATESELRNAPFHWFQVGPAEFKAGADPAIVSQLKNQHWQIQQFLGVRSDVDNLIHSTAQKLADSMYNTIGSVPIDPLWALPKLKDPLKFMRSIAFHAKLGMFAVPQLLVQAQTMAVVAGIGGIRNSIPATAGAFFSRLTMHNQSPEILGHLDKMMTRLKMPGVGNWKAGEFIESDKALKRSGFMNVAGEVAMRDDMAGPKVLQGAWGRFLDAGTVFFTEGERFSRTAAWHVAYREFRDANPIGRLTDQNLKQILERADTLTVNMTRASSSMLHTGVMAFPSQFLTYQIRMAELMWGKRLTQTEKAKVLGVQAALYGIPTSLGVTGLPIGDFFRKAALENGYNVGENWFESTLTEGLPAAMYALMTGDGDMSRGRWLNFGDRFGAQGFETIREAWRGEESIWAILGGASFSVAKGFWDGSDGFREAMFSGLRDDGKKIPMTVDDVVDVFKEVSSVNAAWKGLLALNTGRWYSKKENYLGDVSASQAIVMSLTGLQDTNASDLNLMAWSSKDKAALEKYVGEQFTQELRRAIRIQNDNPEQARKYMTRAFAFLNVGGYPEEKRAQLIGKASQDYQSLIESMNWSFYQTNVPDDKKAVRQNTLINKLKIQEEQRNNR